jgi:hypothetical protein
LFLAATRRARSAWQSRSEKKRTLCCRARHVKVQIGTIFVDAPRTQKQDTKGLYAHLGSAQPKNAPAGCGCSSPCLIARESLRVGSFAHVARVRAAVLAHGWLQPRYFWAVLLWRRSPKAPYAAFLSGAGQAVAVRSLALRLRRARRGRRALSQLLQRLAKKLARYTSIRHNRTNPVLAHLRQTVARLLLHDEHVNTKARWQAAAALSNLGRHFSCVLCPRKGVRGFTAATNGELRICFVRLAFVAQVHRCVGSSGFFWSLTAKER